MLSSSKSELEMVEKRSSGLSRKLLGMPVVLLHTDIYLRM